MTGQAPKRVLVLGASGMLGNAYCGCLPTAQGTTPAALRAPGIRAPVARGASATPRDRRGCREPRQPGGRAGQGPSGCGDQLRRRGQAAGRGGRSACRYSDQRAALHRLARLCAVAGARLVHVSTDCVFSGARDAHEADFADANDLYGRSKYLGEVDYLNAVTLRTSIIGHELASAHGLVGWFPSQHGTVKWPPRCSPACPRRNWPA